MIKSMTAYACEESTDKDLQVLVEIRAYNSRHLDVALRLPAAYAALEEKVKRVIAGQVVRGRVEVRVQVKDMSEAACVYDIDLTRARAYQAALQRLLTALKHDQTIALEHLLGVPGIIQTAENPQKADEHWPALEGCLTRALQALDRMKCQEGDFLKDDIRQRLQGIRKALDSIETAARDLPALYRDKLEARIASLTQGLVELDPVRMAQETALLADRSDIAEEIVRARSHLDQFQNLIAGQEAAGRRLNFLLQELNREFNTMGAKVGQAQIAHTIVEVKAEFEKIREQVQNIE